MPRTAAPYDALAAGYDVVMEHVDYPFWADYVHTLVQQHLPGARTLLELGCGTGSLALELQPLGPYQYHGTDASAAMIRVAEAKAELYGADVSFSVADFTAFTTDTPVDVVVLLYDGLNYLLDPRDVRLLMARAAAALRPGGLFVFDQSTPANSENNEAFFEDEGSAEGFRYKRTSHYDRATRLHTTSFEIDVQGTPFHETHVQRAYHMEEVRLLIPESFAFVAAYDGFSPDAAGEHSERVHWVLRRA